jgi:hypothetical protein
MLCGEKRGGGVAGRDGRGHLSEACLLVQQAATIDLRRTYTS